MNHNSFRLVPNGDPLAQIVVPEGLAAEPSAHFILIDDDDRSAGEALLSVRTIE
jgi:hypothetical protein